MRTQGTILIAEDDASITDMIVDMLTDEGYAVQTVASGRAALAVIQTTRPDLALIDLYIPDMHGWAVLEAVRAQQRDVPIVIMTASTLAGDELEAAGAQVCRFKPFALDDLLTGVAQHLRRR